VAAARRLGPARVVVAVPTAPASTCQRLRGEADEVVCATTPRPFRAVGYSYRSFPQTSDEEVRALLRSARGPGPDPKAPGPAGPDPGGPGGAAAGPGSGVGEPNLNRSS
jgi:predicted phosphoribosyltransferase